MTHAWEQRKLGELSEIVRGASPRPIKDKRWFDQNSDVGWLRISDVTAQNGKIHYLSQKLSKEGQSKTRVLSTPHLLLSIAASVGKPVINYTKTGVHDGFLIFLTPLFNIMFVFEWLEYFRPKWQRYGQPGSQVNLNSAIVKKQNIHIPTSTEQNKVAELLMSFNKYLDLHQRKISILGELKRNFLVQMFTKKEEVVPEIRFKNFITKWEYRKLKEISQKVLEKNKEGFYTTTLTNSAELGIVPQKSYFEKSISNPNNISGYFIVEPNDFVYNPRISHFAPVGPINKNNLSITGIMSPLYYVFKTTGINQSYLEKYFDSSHWHRFMYMNGDSGARADRFAIKDKTLIEMPIPYPEKKEQNKIGIFLDYFDRCINLHQKKINILMKLKNTYLKKMFH